MVCCDLPTREGSCWLPDRNNPSRARSSVQQRFIWRLKLLISATLDELSYTKKQNTSSSGHNAKVSVEVFQVLTLAEFIFEFVPVYVKLSRSSRTRTLTHIQYEHVLFPFTSSCLLAVMANRSLSSLAIRGLLLITPNVFPSLLSFLFLLTKVSSDCVSSQCSSSCSALFYHTPPSSVSLCKFLSPPLCTSLSLSSTPGLNLDGSFSSLYPGNLLPIWKIPLVLNSSSKLTPSLISHVFHVLFFYLFLHLFPRCATSLWVKDVGCSHVVCVCVFVCVALAQKTESTIYPPSYELC